MVGRNLLQAHGMLGAVKPVDQQLWAGLGQTGVACLHTVACPQSGIALAKPFVSRGSWKGLMDARCQEHNHPEKTLKGGRRESGTDVTVRGTGLFLACWVTTPATLGLLSPG